LRRNSAPAAIAGLWTLLASACGLVSVDQMTVASFPSARNQVIGRGERITLSFSISPDRSRAEDLARILTPDGPAELDFSWDGSVLALVPVVPLPAGERLVLVLAGDLAAADGRVFPIAVQVPFFVQSDGPRPRLSSSLPADGSSAGTRTPLVFSFSRPMDRESFAGGFSLAPDTERETAWSPDGSTVTVTPREQWENLVLYTWQIAASVSDASGVGLGVPPSGCFRTQQDATAPFILSLRPATANPDGTFTVVDSPLDGNLRARDCILLSFSEDVTIESLRRAFRVDPSVSGSFTRERAGEFFYVPAEPWGMGRRHHLAVSTDVEDLAGNRMAEEQSAWFLPDIPVQAVISVTANAGPAIVPNDIAPVDVTLAVDGDIVFVVEFARPFEPADRAAVPFAARCEAVFPLSLQDPALKSAAWGSAASLTIAFSGFSVGTAPGLHYYRLLFPGGPTGIPNAEGSYLEEDAWVAIVAR
jgi:hypothetical protein